VPIVARGGTGKTQLALRFVSENLSRFTHIWFFDATSDATLAADFKKLGKATCVGESVNDVKDFLKRMHEDWLVIFDNADDSKVDLSKYIPQCNHGNIIITSRLTEVHQMASFGLHLDFSDLTQSDAVDLLLKHAHENSDTGNQQLASDIVDALGYQALAVATAGAYIASTATCTLSNYLSLFKWKCKQLLNYKMKSLEGYQNTVYSAFQLSFDQLSFSTQLFMQICAGFHHTAIPVELFYHASAFLSKDLFPEEKDKTPAIDEMKHFLSLFANNGLWDDAINELSHFSLTMYDIGTKTLSFHSVLHMCVQETIVDKEKIYSIARLLLACATPIGDTNSDYQFWWQMITHVDHMLPNKFFTILIYNCFGNIFADAHMWIKAQSIRQKALVYCEYYLGKSHPQTLICMFNLIETYYGQGQLEEAEKLVKETLKLQKEVLGEHHVNTLVSMSNLANTYYKQRHLEEAEKLGEEILKLSKDVLGE
ncbi:P-loop containing nucleoside triphosphate hydrolase protein, partial [Armillaria luteobubalina]